MATLVKTEKPARERPSLAAPTHVPMLTLCRSGLSLVMAETPMLPSSLMLLNTAHEYLGRRSWCCNSDGALLRFYVSTALLARAGGGGGGRGMGGAGWDGLAPWGLLAWPPLHWGLLCFFDFVCDYSELPEKVWTWFPCASAFRGSGSGLDLQVGLEPLLVTVSVICVSGIGPGPS